MSTKGLMLFTCIYKYSFLSILVNFLISFIYYYFPLLKWNKRAGETLAKNKMNVEIAITLHCATIAKSHFWKQSKIQYTSSIPFLSDYHSLTKKWIPTLIITLTEYRVKSKKSSLNHGAPLPFFLICSLPRKSWREVFCVQQGKILMKALSPMGFEIRVFQSGKIASLEVE